MVSYHSGLTDQRRLLQLTPRDIKRMENRRASNRRAADKCRKKKKALEALKQEACSQNVRCSLYVTPTSGNSVLLEVLPPAGVPQRQLLTTRPLLAGCTTKSCRRVELTLRQNTVRAFRLHTGCEMAKLVAENEQLRTSVQELTTEKRRLADMLKNNNLACENEQLKKSVADLTDMLAKNQCIECALGDFLRTTNGQHLLDDTAALPPDQ
ncbi:hypothetical protein LSAT2_029298 [Lamellibrachia satsuma]|nr:hypothetical protein LSAT2_029298 [Lamellibrachia satsuma]